MQIRIDKNAGYLYWEGQCGKYPAHVYELKRAAGTYNYVPYLDKCMTCGKIIPIEITVHDT